MVLPRRQRLVNRRIVARKGSQRRAGKGGASTRRMSHRGRGKGALRGAWNCGLRGRDIPPPHACRGVRLWRRMRSNGRSCRGSGWWAREASRRGRGFTRSDDDDAGAQAVRRGGGDGQCSPCRCRRGLGRSRAALAMAVRIPAVGDPGDGRYRLVPRHPALGRHRHHRIRAGSARDHRGAVQRQGQPDAVAHHPQHAARGALDGRPGRDPGVDRDALVPAPVPPAQHAAGRPHHQGDRQAVVLDLQLSGRQVRVQFADPEEKDRKARPRRVSSASTTRSWCR